MCVHVQVRACACACVCVHSGLCTRTVFVTKVYMVYIVGICFVYSLAVTSDMHRPTCRTGPPATVHVHVVI